MTPLPLGLDGAFLLRGDVHEDLRGSFVRTFCAEEFARFGLPTTFVQSNLSTNRRRHTLRGLHYQAAPHGEGKLISCVRGAIYDVLVDLREDSETYASWVGVELRAATGSSIYAPPGLAHGFLTLEDDVLVHYQMTAPYVESAAGGVRYDDPFFGVEWPAVNPIVSARDLSFPSFISERRAS